VDVDNKYHAYSVLVLQIKERPCRFQIQIARQDKDTKLKAAEIEKYYIVQYWVLKYWYYVYYANVCTYSKLLLIMITNKQQCYYM
jgi:hypothetical protein